MMHSHLQLTEEKDNPQKNFLVVFSIALNDPLLQIQGKGIRGKSTIKPGGVTDLQLPLAHYSENLSSEDSNNLFLTISAILTKKVNEHSKNRTAFTHDFYLVWQKGASHPENWQATSREWHARAAQERSRCVISSRLSRASISHTETLPCNEEKITKKANIGKIHIEWLIFHLERILFWLPSEKSSLSEEKLNNLLNAAKHSLVANSYSFSELHILFNPNFRGDFFQPSIETWQTKFLNLVAQLQEYNSHPSINNLLQDIEKITQKANLAPKPKIHKYFTYEIVYFNEKFAQEALSYLKSATSKIFIPAADDHAGFNLYIHIKNILKKLNYFIQEKFYQPSQAVSDFELVLKFIAKDEKLAKSTQHHAASLLKNLKERNYEDAAPTQIATHTS